MNEQLNLLNADADEETISTEELFRPNGSQRCPTCRKRLHWFGGRLMCLHPPCPRVAS